MKALAPIVVLAAAAAAVCAAAASAGPLDLSVSYLFSPDGKLTELMPAA